MLSLQCSWCVNAAPVWRIFVNLCSDCQPGRLGNCQNARSYSSVSYSLPSPRQTRSEALEALLRPAAPCQSCQITDSISLNSQTLDTNSPLLTAEQVSNAKHPAFSPLAAPVFTWGSLDAQTFTSSLLSIYGEVMGWRKNCFKLPQGSTKYWWIGSFFDTFASHSACWLQQNISFLHLPEAWEREM